MSSSSKPKEGGGERGRRGKGGRGGRGGGKGSSGSSQPQQKKTPDGEENSKAAAPTPPKDVPLPNSTLEETKETPADKRNEATKEPDSSTKKVDDILTRYKNSIVLLQDTIELAEERQQARTINESTKLKATRAQFNVEKKKLKTDLKKCTAFVRKVKTSALYSLPIPEIKTELASLNLSRYVEEVVAAVLESKPKIGELHPLIVLCQEMHVRYSDFRDLLVTKLWKAVLKPDPTTVKLRRMYIRLLTECLCYNILGTSDSNKLKKHLETWTGAANNYQVSDAVAVTAFVKSAHVDILGIVGTSLQDALRVVQDISSAEDVSAELKTQGQDLHSCVTQLVQTNRALSPELVQLYSEHCCGAYETLSKSLVHTHEKLQKLEKRCEQDRLLSGTLSAQREKNLNDARKLFVSLQKSVEAMSDCLNRPFPFLKIEQDDEQVKGSGVEVWTKEGNSEDYGPFDDEETRAFYYDIPDLLTTIPSALLGISEEEIEKRKAANLKKYGNTVEETMDESTDVTPSSEEMLDAAEGGELPGGDDADAAMDGEGDDAANKDAPHYKLTLLLEQELPECNRREQLDELTEKFCTNHGSSKNSRKRLLKTLFLVPRSRLDLLPFYSRMATTLDRVWNDICPGLVTDLEQQFHGQAKFKKNQNLDSRMRTARYIGELTKFRSAPPIVALRCMERCIEDFTGSNVDVVSCLLESCGRYLFRMNHTNAKIINLMETMERLAKAKNLDERMQSLLKAAFYSVKPPPSGPRKKAKVYPPLESYLRHLLLSRLDSSDAEISAVTRQIVRLPWNDATQQCGALVCKLMLKACRRGRYKTIEAIASVAARLRTQRVASEATIRLIDAVLEELRWALDNPNFRDQQRMIVNARLLGELHSCAQVGAHVIFQQLYDFINIGHEIPAALREASKKLEIEAASSEQGTGESSDEKTRALPVYNSASGVTDAIQEDEEMEDPNLETNIVTEEPIKPMAVSVYSKYDPRVPSLKDPPNSTFRVTLVCTLLDATARQLVTRNNLPKLKGFLAAFQRYLFTKPTLPTDVEFALLDTFDVIDSQLRRFTKGPSRGGNAENKAESDNTFPRYSTWLDAHNATVAIEEAEAASESQKRARLEMLADDTKAIYDAGDPDNGSVHDEDNGSQEEEDNESISMSIETAGTEHMDDTAEIATVEEGEEPAQSWVSEGDSDGLESESGEDDDDEEEEEDDDDDEDEDQEADEDSFDEEAHMLQMEEEAFERELRRVTMDALDKGRVASRKQVGDSMISGSQIVKRKVNDEHDESGHAGVTLGGEQGISFQVLKRGNKGKVESKQLVVPVGTNLARVATRQDDAAARERHEIKQRVLRYEEQSAESEFAGGNVYIEQEKLQRNRNRRLDMDDIDKNFGTSGGNLQIDQAKKKPGRFFGQGRPSATGSQAPVIRPVQGRGVPGRGAPGRVSPSGRGRGGRSSSSGRTLF